MKPLIVRSVILLTIVYGLYWSYLEFCPTFYNEATNNRWHFLKTTFEEKQNYAHCSTLFLGDSRLNAGVVFRDIDSSFNVSAGGASSIEMYFILKKYLESYPAPQKIVLSQSPRFFKELFAFWGYAVRNDFFEKRELDEIFTAAELLQDTILGTCPRGQAWLFKLKYFKYYQPDLRASRIFFGKKRNRKMTTSMIVERGRRPHPLRYQSHSGLNYETRYDSFEPSPLLDLYFDKLLELCQKHSIEVVFLNMPMNESSFKKLSPSFKSGFSSYLEQKSKSYSHVLFETNLYAWPDSMFGDPSHLHMKGAKFFTDSLKVKLGF